jgi:hypothetical protein
LRETDFFVSALNPAPKTSSGTIMDTLDKKMQTIIEREDLLADKRLKLYDQSFTRYLNVYDNYRPRPVAVAPEPVKQYLIDEEILKSVPKTIV